ncbi:MAG: hypothetical protein U0931_22900 [Vulcanimicrobiota bacterium]
MNRSLALDPQTSSAASKLQAAATTTPEGKKALADLTKGLSQDSGQAGGLDQGRKPLAQKPPVPEAPRPGPVATVTVGPQASGGDLHKEALALSQPDGLAAFREKTLQQAQTVGHSTAAVARLADAVATPEGRAASTLLLSAVASDPDVSTAFVKVQAQASHSNQGLTALGLLNQGIVRDPKLALAVAQVHAQASTLGPGRLAISQMAANLPPAQAATSVRIEAQVVATPEGRAALAHLNVGLALDPTAAQNIQAMRMRARSQDAESSSVIHNAAQTDPVLAQSIKGLELAAQAQLTEAAARTGPAGKSAPELVAQPSTAEGPVLEAESAGVEHQTSREVLRRGAFEARLDYKETVITEASQEEEVEKLEGVSKPRSRARVVEPAQVNKVKNLEEVQPVSLFEPGDRTGHNCRRCGTDFQARVACCPTCQNELRQILATNSTSFQRAGYLISRQSDRVEVSRDALNALSEENQFVHLRGATVFVQMRDVLAACQQKVTAYATVGPRKPSRPVLD